jgi:hypothetical protein
VPPLLVSKVQAAELLAISVDSFERHVMPSVRVTRIGNRCLFAVRELEDWIERESASPLEADLARLRA